MQTIQKFCSSEVILAPRKWMWKAFTRSDFRILHIAQCVCARFCFCFFFGGGVVERSITWSPAFSLPAIPHQELTKECSPLSRTWLFCAFTLKILYCFSPVISDLIERFQWKLRGLKTALDNKGLKKSNLTLSLRLALKWSSSWGKRPGC